MKLRKRYPLKISPFFHLRGKDKLERLLDIRWEAMPGLSDTKNYRVWTNTKGRQIESPVGRLKVLHQHIGELLSRIELPDYVYSQKGRSYADNGRAHVGDVLLAKTDIHHFFPSVTRRMVRRTFLDDFGCAADIAHRLADLCCYAQEYVPTGSPLSGQLAFLATRHMFNEIDALAHSVGCRLTVYVDDITISGNHATKELLGEVRQIIRRHGLKTSNRKSKTYARGAAKTVTGTIVTGNEVRLPNRRHLGIHRARQDLQTASPSEKLHIRRVLVGRLQEARQVDRSVR